MIVEKQLKEFIDNNFIIVDSDIPNDDGKVYCSKIDGAFIAIVGMEEIFTTLYDNGITEQIQDGYGEPTVCCIGFNPKEQKWYGWSHRAMFGFGIGSKCSKGDCGYKPSNKEDFIEREVSFWGGEYALNGVVDYIEKKDGVLVYYTYNNEVPNVSLRGKKYEHFSKFPKIYGRGEWVAKTLEDAKIMATEFAESVS